MQLKPLSGETDGWNTSSKTAIHQLNISTSYPAVETRPVGYDCQDVAIDHKHNSLKATDLGRHALLPWVTSINRQGHVTKCVLNPIKNDAMLASQLIILSLIIAREVELGGGLLLHGALVERDGQGVILAGPSGVGKTTISRRLPPPWRSLCDDTTLLIRDDQGVYWAHPWPTWSNFMFGGQGGSWDVHHAVRLAGIFFLNQATEDLASQVGPAEATCLLNEVAEQVSRLMLHTMSPDEVRAHRLRRFETICSTAKQAPVFRLRMSPAGTFWCEIEEVLHQNGGTSWAMS